MTNSDGICLDKHFSITSSEKIGKIVAPVVQAFGVKYFRYLKIYNDGKRIILSNRIDCTKFTYESDHYKKLWLDGEFPEKLTIGWHIWDTLRTIHEGGEKTPFEHEINQSLGLFHGMSYVERGIDFYEIFTFDSDKASVYQIDKKLLLRFIFYFKEQAAQIIKYAENEKIDIPLAHSLIANSHDQNGKIIINFLNDTNINRYYLNGKYSHVYITNKEVQCLYWLVRGKSAEEIATIIGNTKKTVERHLLNVRKRLDCYKQTDLIRVIIQSGIFDLDTDY